MFDTLTKNHNIINSRCYGDGWDLKIYLASSQVHIIEQSTIIFRHRKKRPDKEEIDGKRENGRADIPPLISYTGFI